MNVVRPSLFALLALIALLAAGGVAWEYRSVQPEVMVELPLPPEPPRLAAPPGGPRRQPGEEAPVELAAAGTRAGGGCQAGAIRAVCD